jgi:hypothetical protein
METAVETAGRTTTGRWFLRLSVVLGSKHETPRVGAYDARDLNV